MVKEKVQTKRAGKSSSKTATKAVEVIDDQHNSTGREIAGWSLIVLSILFLISLVSEFASVNSQNIMGAYLGEWLATAIVRTGGKLPSLIFIALLLSSGINTLRLSGAKISGKVIVVLGIFFLEMSVLLSLKNIEVQQFALQDFENTGGILGNFLVNFLYATLFGESILFAYTFTLLLMVFTLIWATSFRPSAFVDSLIIFFKDRREAQRQRKLERLQHEQVLSKDETKKRKKIAKVKPAQDETEIDESEMELPPIGADEITNDYIIELETMAKDTSLDPREKRRIRDELARVQRISELNEWEDRETRKVKIGGILAKKSGDEKSKKKKSGSAVDLADELKIKSEAVAVLDIPEDEKETREISIIKQREIDEAKKREVKYDDYAIPDISSILPAPPFQEVSYTEEELIELSKHLETQLANFRVKGKVTGICTGPIITRFEIDLAPGVKVSKIAGLSEDLALALRAKSVRILAPIPGKAAVGIEIPNTKPHIVYGRDVFESEAFDPEPDNIMLALGKDIAGEAFTLDLAAAPHLLIAGQTGSGKSVCINTIMASILASKTPDELRMILVDPKVVELKPYEKIPHLLHPVITSPDIAIQALKWACIEMDRRYEVLAQAGVRNLFGFNKKFKDGKLNELLEEEDNALMPYLVIVIDELADLMMVAGKEVETSIARIAQKARAVGIHLILATQRPSVQVITGTIKANLPSRIAFKVASQIDARTILDKMGAEKLLGRGDMLVRTVRDPEPLRAHGAFLSDADVESIVAKSANQFVNYPQIEAFETGDEDSAGDRDLGPRDSKFNDAAELVVHAGSASTSMLQRRLGVGYARAGKIIDQLEGAGIIGPPKGSKPREVLLNDTELMSFLSGDVDQIILDEM